MFRKFLKNKIKNEKDKIKNNIVENNILEIINILGSKKQVFLRNFMAGISRGIGIGIGVTIISALIVFILQRIVMLNIPIIGSYIKDIVEIVQKST